MFVFKMFQDLEFFDFENSSDEEIKEIQAILKGPGSNGCVEVSGNSCHWLKN